ncbi:MAG: AMP-binding protein [Desulfohalobiaceae bacterium]
MSIEIGKTRIGDVVEENARQLKDNVALAYYEYDFRMSFADFDQMCNRVAKGLMALGVQRGDHFSCWANNLPEWVYTQFGSAKMGGVMVTVNTNFRSYELEYLLKQSDSNTLILTGGIREPDEYIKVVNEVLPELKDSEPGKLQSEKLPYLKNVVYLGEEKIPGMFNWKDMLQMGDSVPDADFQARKDSLDPEDVIMMQYTSGTTGYPKGVMLTHSNLLGNAHSMAETMGLTPEDALCIPVPFFHCFGCVIGTMCCTVSGATMVPITTFNPKTVLEAIDKYKCTAVHGVPTMFIAELEEMDKAKYDTSHLRTGVMAGSTCPVEVMRGVIDKMGAEEMTIVYGQTESSPGITQTRRDDSMEVRTETVGRALPNVEVKVVDPDTGKDLGPHQTGELCSRGYHIMRGYYKMPDKTQETIDSEGWLHTGDLATVDEKGNYTIVGRLKDMIIRGGENIYPREIEEFLYTHPKIKDVQVVGVPSKKYGEEVAAFIQLRSDVGEASEEEIKDFCKDTIAYYKIPQYTFFVQDFPTTASGKIQKYKLREQAMQEIGEE